ncbi:DNA helicase/exodeoxyribonuclease V gamma subunit [Desulfobotulus alkaliphilus]|uniref:DNA helicase/exodeoxyribonuclease V gamma subunit n=1 Tax=Desulfobotulus alkaliphilus TaxID=622671 RepID=A0A562RHQ3_9BACT|nr:exodeoxyribonuclease V subunit gamma [Desulfobotulus alkaliphilus]TWI68625.1 DNA helicase/exodeoxyribonuclease V gamma subunit [Desulfobotulus alkaliphilus]
MQRFVSNRMEVLAANLAAHLMEDASDPMEPEIIVVQSRGMERWLSMEMAKWAGIASNTRFLFPASLMTKILRPVSPLSPDEDPWKPDTLRWACFEALASLPDSPDSGAVDRYMGDDPLKRFQLADMLADLFDQYLMFRPDRVLAWEKGEEDHFQAELWRMLHKNIDAPHRVALLQLGATSLKNARLPRRISIFGVSALPPLYLDFLELLSESVDIRWYLLDPCQEYWGEVRCEAFWEQSAFRAEEEGLALEDLHAEKGHPLLASLGRTGQDFFRRLAGMRGEEMRHSLEPGVDTLLHRLQSRILSLEILPSEPLSEDVLESDDSIAIHRCHGPMREMEVLRDQILRLFSEENPPKPRDILVMFPDVGAYAPYIDAVFSRSLPDGRRIPYSISERPLAMENGLAGLLLRVMQLMDSRFGASEVFDLMEAEPIAKKFSLDEEGLDRIRRWLVDTRIRWGLDAAFKEAMDLPGQPSQTWRFGLDRMLLGMAMEDEGGMPEAGGILAHDPMGPEAADTLNSLLGFMDILTAFYGDIRENRSPGEWMDLLWDLVQGLFHENAGNTEEFLGLRVMLDTFVEETRLGNLKEKLSFSMMRSVLAQRLEQAGQGGMILSGGITFCAMVPMRCIPFSVVCLCGMNDGAFPRSRPRPAFDIMQQEPRPGDRSSRDDDRYLFLETLLSARDRLIITCTGFRPEDDQPLPPSVMVQELLDAVKGDEGGLPPNLLQNHPMQPFSLKLFLEKTPKPGRPFSFHAPFRDIAEALYTKKESVKAIFQDEKLEAEAESHTLFFEDLIRFYEDPSAFFLKRILGIAMEREEEVSEDRETFTLSGLDTYIIKDAICNALLDGRDVPEIMTRLEAEGMLPMGSPGKNLVQDLVVQSGALVSLIRETPGEAGSGQEPFALELEGLKLEGSFPIIDGKEEKRWRPGQLKEKHLLAAWLYFLVRRAMDMELDLYLVGEQKKGKGKLKGLDSKFFMASAISRKDAMHHLKYLIGLYSESHSRPIAFFPAVSKVWADAVSANENLEDMEEKLQKAWEGGGFNGHAKSTASDLILWRGRNPFEEPFTEIAEAIWLPILEVLKDNKS